MPDMGLSSMARATFHSIRNGLGRVHPVDGLGRDRVPTTTKAKRAFEPQGPRANASG